MATSPLRRASRVVVLVLCPVLSDPVLMNEPESWRVEVFHDGDCPLCAREIALLRRLDRGRGRIRFTDIADPEFSAAALGKTLAEFTAKIQARLPDGTWIEGVEVFRRLYAAVGLGALSALTRLPLVSQALDAGYRVFARNRLRWTGRGPRLEPACAADACQVRGEPRAPSLSGAPGSRA